jgi:lipopolysaccharide transport system ATP-binding protein
MDEPMITVEGLGKRYTLGRGQDARTYQTMRDRLAGLLAAPAGWLRKRPQSRGDAVDFWALKDVSFEVQTGEVVGIIGRNGAGKSTLLKVLSRITEPTEGRVTLHGRVASLLEVGTGFHPELTGRENIYLNGAVLGMARSEIARKFDEIVDFAEVERFLDTPVKRYSSGMYVRLAFAVAAHMEPEILIVDEVLAVGDAEFQKKCLGKMGRVASAGRTVLFVSHNLAVVEALCSRAVLLGAGRIHLDGPVGAVISRYHAMSSNGRAASATAFAHAIRRGSSPVFASAALIDEAGNSTSHVRLGGALRIDIEIGRESAILSPSIGIGIDDTMGRRMLDLHNPLRGVVLNELTGRGTITCRVPNLPLAPGEYTIKLAISERTEEIDVIERALTFEVINSDGFEDGRGYLTGLCVARSEWRYTPAPARVELHGGS